MPIWVFHERQGCTVRVNGRGDMKFDHKAVFAELASVDWSRKTRLGEPSSESESVSTCIATPLDTCPNPPSSVVLEQPTTDDKRMTAKRVVTSQTADSTHIRGRRSLPTLLNADAVVDILSAQKLTVPEAAKRLGIGETKMRELISNGDIPVVRILGKIILLERDLEAYLQSHYGSLRKAERQATRMPSLPKHIFESGLLKKTG